MAFVVEPAHQARAQGGGLGGWDPPPLGLQKIRIQLKIERKEEKRREKEMKKDKRKKK